MFLYPQPKDGTLNSNLFLIISVWHEMDKKKKNITLLNHAELLLQNGI